jgi:hypothetical protein
VWTGIVTPATRPVTAAAKRILFSMAYSVSFLGKLGVPMKA